MPCKENNMPTMTTDLSLREKIVRLYGCDIQIAFDHEADPIPKLHRTENPEQTLTDLLEARPFILQGFHNGLPDDHGGQNKKALIELTANHTMYPELARYAVAILIDELSQNPGENYGKLFVPGTIAAHELLNAKSFPAFFEMLAQRYSQSVDVAKTYEVYFNLAEVRAGKSEFDPTQFLETIWPGGKSDFPSSRSEEYLSILKILMQDFADANIHISAERLLYLVPPIPFLMNKKAEARGDLIVKIIGKEYGFQGSNADGFATEIKEYDVPS